MFLTKILFLIIFYLIFIFNLINGFRLDKNEPVGVYNGIPARIIEYGDRS